MHSSSTNILSPFKKFRTVPRISLYIAYPALKKTHKGCLRKIGSKSARNYDRTTKSAINQRESMAIRLRTRINCYLVPLPARQFRIFMTFRINASMRSRQRWQHLQTEGMLSERNLVLDDLRRSWNEFRGLNARAASGRKKKVFLWDNTSSFVRTSPRCC